MEIFGFEVYHEYIIEYVEAAEHNTRIMEFKGITFILSTQSKIPLLAIPLNTIMRVYIHG